MGLTKQKKIITQIFLTDVIIDKPKYLTSIRTVPDWYFPSLKTNSIFFSFSKDNKSGRDYSQVVIIQMLGLFKVKKSSKKLQLCLNGIELVLHHDSFGLKTASVRSSLISEL